MEQTVAGMPPTATRTPGHRGERGGVRGAGVGGAEHCVCAGWGEEGPRLVEGDSHGRQAGGRAATESGKPQRWW